MAGTFSNPRLAALPCELMSSCSFAENWVSALTVAENKGIFTGAGYSVDRGLTLTATDFVTFDEAVQPGNFSVTTKFKTSTLATSILAVDNFGGSGWGITFNVDGTIRFTVTDAGEEYIEFIPTDGYDDGEWHTITYIVDKTGGNHYVYYDSDDVRTDTIVASGSTGGAGNLIIGGSYIGEVGNIRVFNSTLTEAEHDLYHAGDIRNFLDQPLSVLRCDSINDDTTGDKLLDRTLNLNHIDKGDGAGTGEPTFSTDKYIFDGVNDLISGSPTLPTLYTVTGTESDGSTHPSVNQDNDSTFLTTLETSGGFTGNLHSLLYYSKVLEQLELNHDKYQQLSRVDRGRAKGPYHRLVTEGTCKLAVFLDDGVDWLEDLSPSLRTGVNTGATHLADQGGATFGAGDNIEFSDDAAFELPDSGTIAIYGVFTTTAAAGTLLDKGTNYKLRTNGNNLDFNGSTIAHTFDNNELIAVTFKDGLKPRFYVDWVFVGEGSSTITLDGTDTTNVTIGNDNAYGENTTYALKHITITDQPLIDSEVIALYEQSRIINASS